MDGRECYHCKQWVGAGEAHDCWTTTEASLIRDLPENLQEAWERIRETAVEFGEQRIYASHNSIMFSRKSCYFFVRPKKSFLEVCLFLGRTLKAPQISRARRTSKVKVAHTIHIRHRDQVEPPVTDWLREAYELTDMVGDRAAAPLARTAPNAARAKPAPTAARAKPSPKRKAGSSPSRSGSTTKPKTR